MHNNNAIRDVRSCLLSLTLALGAGVSGCDLAGDAAGDPRSIEPGAPDDDDGCTLTQGYWKNHHAGAKNHAQQQPWPVDEAVSLCGQTWLEILQTPPKGDAWYILAHQWIAASLNVASGALAPPDVVAALTQGEALLADCSIDADEHDAAIADAGLLDDFNNGAVGPGHCDDGPGDGDDDGGDATTGSGGEDTGDGDDDSTGADDSTGWPIPQ